MMKLDVAGALNTQVACTRCRTSKCWILTARPTVRQYSNIYRLRCAHCGEQVVAKAVGGRYSSDYALAHARKEYESLCELQSKFPQDEQYGTLAPLGHLEYAGQGIVLTRRDPGKELGRYLRTLDSAGMQTACRSSGVWLRKLHESDVQSQQKCLGVADKISFLADTYGAVLRRDPQFAGVYELLARQGSKIDAVPSIGVRLHGDFKPNNILCDGTRYVGVDIPWRNVGSAAYDLAPFLNHLWLGSRGITASHRRRRYESMELAFLSGYGNVNDMRALRWVQLYFALCYAGEYLQRGRLAASYARWKAWPLVRRLTMQVREAV